MSNWTDETRAKAVKMYLEAEPTPETNAEIIKDIAEELEESPNGTRIILMKAGVYKTAPAKTSTKDNKSEAGGGTKRVSKETLLNELKEAIKSKGCEVDEDVISKLTGKAASYFTTIIKG